MAVDTTSVSPDATPHQYLSPHTPVTQCTIFAPEKIYVIKRTIEIYVINPIVAPVTAHPVKRAHQFVQSEGDLDPNECAPRAKRISCT